MGRDKALLQLEGEPMALRVADALQVAGAAQVFLVGGDAALAHHGVSLLADEHPGEGPLGGLVTALRHAAHALVVVLACDLLDPSTAAIERLVDEAMDHAAHAAVVPMVGDRPQWLHAAWRPTACLPPLASAFDDGERSIHGAAAVLDLRFVDDPGPGFADADAPEDLDDRG